MKLTSLLLAASLLIGVAGYSPTVKADTNSVSPPAATVPPGSQMPPITPGQILANLPTTPLASETLGVSEGMGMRDDSTFISVTFIDYSFASKFFARAEVDAGTGGGGIQGVGLGGGIYKTWTAARVWGDLGGRRDFASSPGGEKWDGIAGVGVAYTPSTNGIFANFSTFAEQRIVLSDDKTTGVKVKVQISPHGELDWGIRYSF